MKRALLIIGGVLLGGVIIVTGLMAWQKHEWDKQKNAINARMLKSMQEQTLLMKETNDALEK